jgi:hypothetical protein
MPAVQMSQKFFVDEKNGLETVLAARGQSLRRGAVHPQRALCHADLGDGQRADWLAAGAPALRRREREARIRLGLEI